MFLITVRNYRLARCTLHTTIDSDDDNDEILGDVTLDTRVPIGPLSPERESKLCRREATGVSTLITCMTRVDGWLLLR